MKMVVKSRLQQTRKPALREAFLSVESEDLGRRCRFSDNVIEVDESIQ